MERIELMNNVSLSWTNHFTCACPEQPGNWAQEGRFLADVVVLLGTW